MSSAISWMRGFHRPRWTPLWRAAGQGSMSRRGNPYDNAIMESFMKTLKYEEVYPREYTTVEDVVRHLPEFIEERYARQPLHSSLGYRPPEEFEMLHTSPAA